MYYVVIPYFAAAAQGRELEYAVAGWRRYFRHMNRIVIIGDYHPVSDSGPDISYYPCDRVADIPGQYRPHLDMNHKMLTFIRAFPDVKEFIWVADDCYPVNYFGIEEVQLLKCMPRSLKSFEKGARTACEEFRIDKLKTLAFLRGHGCAIRNFTTHLPRLYRSEQLQQVIKEVDATHNSYVIEDLYYNIFFPERIPLKLNRETDNLKYGLYEDNIPEADIRKALQEKIWITNSNKGFTPTLVKVLEEHFFGK